MIAAVSVPILALASLAMATPTSVDQKFMPHPVKRVELGPRPYWLINNMDEGSLKSKLQSCSEMNFKRTKMTIGHRGGGTLMIPEETFESIMAGVSRH
jgi:glycerophosphoryl diester phosphodiesterase